MKPPPFAYFAPETVREASALLASTRNAVLLAGGQSLVPLLNARSIEPSAVIDLRRIGGLDGVEERNGDLWIGAMVRQRALERCGLVERRAPLLRAAVGHVGHLQTRNRGTLGGSLCQGDPSAELPLAVLALDGVLEIAGPNGHRSQTMESFAAGREGGGLGSGEILTAVRIPGPQGRQVSAFEEFSLKRGSMALVAVAVVLEADRGDRLSKCRIALAGAGPAPERARLAEAAAIGRDVRAGVRTPPDIVAEFQFSDDPHCSAGYRRHLARTLAARAFATAAAQFGAAA